MQMTLTITGSAAQLAAVLASLNSTTALTPALPATVPAVNEDDDFIPFPDNGSLVQQSVAAPVVQQQQPAPVAQPAAAPVANGEVDCNGFPWDERIHSSSKAKTDGGNWRKKRGVPDATVEFVENELRARIAGNAPVVQQQQPAPVAQQPIPAMPQIGADGEQMSPTMQAAVQAVEQQPAPVVAPVVQQQQPIPAMPEQQQPAPVVAQQPVAQPAAVVPAAIDMPTFMAQIGPKMSQIDPATGAALITPEYLAQITAEIANAFQQPLTVITDVANNPAMIKFAADCLARDGKW